MRLFVGALGGDRAGNREGVVKLASLFCCWFLTFLLKRGKEIWITMGLRRAKSVYKNLVCFLFFVFLRKARQGMGLEFFSVEWWDGEKGLEFMMGFLYVR